MKKNDIFIEILNLYYNHYPESVGYPILYKHLYKVGYIKEEEKRYFIRDDNLVSEEEIDNLFSSEKRQKLKIKKRKFEYIFSSLGQYIPESGGMIMTNESYLNRLEFLELHEARKSSQSAFWLSIVAITISFVSAYLAYYSLKIPVILDSQQLNQIIETIHREN